MRAWEILIEKYARAKQSQQELKTKTPLTNAPQHQLLDQNINLFDGIIADLMGAVGNVDASDSKLPLCSVSHSALLEIKNICETTEELPDDFDRKEAMQCDAALTEILRIVEKLI